MSEIKFSQVTDIDNPELRELAMNVVKTMQLAVEKATAHKADPNSYPIAADPDSFEQLFLSRFEQLRPEQQEAGIKNVMSSINAPPAERIRLYGDLAKVDLRSAEAVEMQVAKTFPDLLKAMQNEKNSSEPSIEQSLRATSGTASLEVRIHKVKCIEETDEIGKDDIKLGGNTVDESGDIKKVSAFVVGKFSSGNEKSYNPPITFATFDLLKSPSVGYPRFYFATFVLSEVDIGGGTNEFLDKLIDKIRDAVIAYLTPIAISLGTTVGGLIGSGIPILGTIIGAAIGAAVAYVIVRIFQWLKDLWKDDIFEPVSVKIEVPPLAASFQTPQGMVSFKSFGGEYRLWYDCNVTVSSSPEPTWAKMGDELVMGVGASSWQPGVTDLFVRGTDNLLYYKWWEKNNGWKPNYDLVGPDRGFISGSPVAVSGGGSDLVDVFARGIGANDGLYHKVWQNSTWSNWQRLGTMDTLSSPGLAWEPTRRLNVYFLGTDNALYVYQYTSTGVWAGPWPLDKQISSSPTGISLKSGTAHVFARGMDNTLLHRRYDNGWQPWQPLGGPISGQISADPESSPSVASWGAGHLDVYVRGTDDAVWHKSSKDSGTSWSNWERLGGSILSSPAAISREPNQVEVFAIGKDNKLYHIWQENSVWYPQ
jgi:hypothetical protein